MIRKNITVILLIFCFSYSLSAFPNREMMHSRVGTISRELTYGTFGDPEENLPTLVSVLMAGVNNDTTKVRIIHDWICHNIDYDTEMWFSGTVKKQDYVSVLKKGKAVCSGYSSLFKKMCQLAGIEAIEIKGYSKGFGYFGDLDKADHQWNGVKIGGKWRLVDCCWDAGFVDYKTYVRHYSTQWFLRPAHEFIYSHFPEKQEFQFLPNNKIRTKDDFIKEPYISGKFFQYGLHTTQNIPNYKNEIHGPVKFSFGLLNDDVEITAGLQNNDTTSGIYGLTWIERFGSEYSIEYDVPDKGSYKGYIFAKYKNDVNYPDSFSISDFETVILPGARALVARNPVATKSISQEDFDIFLDAYKKSEENGRYYYDENQFYIKQKNVVVVVLNLLGIENGFLEPVLDFQIQAEENYNGCGFVKKYPDCYNDYNSTTNTHLISPKEGILIEGKSYNFKVSSINYKKIAILEGEDLIPFTKNKETGNFELEYTVPFDATEVVIFGSSNGVNYTGLLKYNVEK